ncbi:MAG: hypothetical protein LBR80_11245 [Deltaproteobacteria bacterium]|nr:hypothetical protein [Deltaproteobacteria bacterium]
MEPLALKHVRNLTDEEMLQKLEFDQLTRHAIRIHNVCVNTNHVIPEAWHNHLNRLKEFALDIAISTSRSLISWPGPATAIRTPGWIPAISRPT